MQQSLVVEDEAITRLELHRADVRLVVRQLREPAPGTVEGLEGLRVQRRGVLAALRREPQRTDGALVVLRDVAAELDVRGGVQQGRVVVPAVVLEAHGHLGQQAEAVRALLPELLCDVEPVDQVVQHGAALARGRARGAAAVLERVEELEVWGPIAIRVVRVEADRARGVGQVKLRPSCLCAGVWHGAHVEEGAPVRGPQRAERLPEPADLPLSTRDALNERCARRQKALDQPKPLALVTVLKHFVVLEDGQLVGVAGPKHGARAIVLVDLDGVAVEASQLRLHTRQEEL
mmetsp:Transcript_91537/g.245466  ORF Transcript_91537/g.245466 Transcript_91537/m.245466 type:complete len:290 (-) Transcript_91537:3-872(-)